MRFHHVQISIPTGQEGLGRHFYGQILGFEEIEKPDNLKKRGGVWYELGDIQIHLGAEDVERIDSRRHVAFLVDDLEQIKEKLQTFGIEIKEDENPIADWRRFYCSDPFNNRIEFLSYG